MWIEAQQIRTWWWRLSDSIIIDWLGPNHLWQLIQNKFIQILVKFQELLTFWLHELSMCTQCHIRNRKVLKKRLSKEIYIQNDFKLIYCNFSSYITDLIWDTCLPYDWVWLHSVIWHHFYQKLFWLKLIINFFVI